MNTARTLVATATLAAAITALTVPAADAASDDVIKRGSCSGSATWKLKAKPRDGRIEVEGEVDSNKNGQTWRWKIKHNGTVSARGRATTKPPSGSFSVNRRMVDLSGKDVFVFRATHNGQVCRGKVSL
ncbi:MAG: hypothetical protein R2731_01470 [Nocardioides sp.]